MPNTTYALEWLELSRRNLETAKLLFRENHYTDIIAVELHQSVEKSFKAVLALHSVRIPKTHDLMVLFDSVDRLINIENQWDNDLLIINDYYQTERYPGPQYQVPERSEIEQTLQIASEIFGYISTHISTTR